MNTLIKLTIGIALIIFLFGYIGVLMGNVLSGDINNSILWALSEIVYLQPLGFPVVAFLNALYLLLIYFSGLFTFIISFGILKLIL